MGSPGDSVGYMEKVLRTTLPSPRPLKSFLSVFTPEETEAQRGSVTLLGKLNPERQPLLQSILVLYLSDSKGYAADGAPVTSGALGRR